MFSTYRPCVHQVSTTDVALRCERRQLMFDWSRVPLPVDIWPVDNCFIPGFVDIVEDSLSDNNDYGNFGLGMRGTIIEQEASINVTGGSSARGWGQVFGLAFTRGKVHGRLANKR